MMKDDHVAENDKEDMPSSLLELLHIVREVKSNHQASKTEFQELKKLFDNETLSLPERSLIIPQEHLNQLNKQVHLLKQTLPKVVNSELLSTYSTVNALQNDVASLEQRLEVMTSERDHWKSRCQTALGDADKHKQEKFQLQCELQEVSKQLSQQSEYCASMGAACCTLLWRVTRCEDSIQAILTGTKVDDFLSMVSSTIESYIQTYQEDMPLESAEETQFILALCGVITNIAASPYGRNFLMTTQQGQHLINTFVTALSEAPPRKCAKMKNLILMSLYNISINQKGLKHISGKTGIIGTLAWQLQEEKAVENRLHSIRLIQSLLYEEHSPQLLHEANEVLTFSFLQELAGSDCTTLREAATELSNDLKAMNTTHS